MWSGALDDFTASPQHRILIKGQQVELLFDESAVLMPRVHMIDGENAVRQKNRKALPTSTSCSSNSRSFLPMAFPERAFRPSGSGVDGLVDRTREELI